MVVVGGVSPQRQFMSIGWLVFSHILLKDHTQRIRVHEFLLRNMDVGPISALSLDVGSLGHSQVRGEGVIVGVVAR